MGDVDGAVDLDESATAFSDADMTQNRMATTAILEQDTDGECAANHKSADTPDEGYDQRVMDIV